MQNSPGKSKRDYRHHSLEFKRHLVGLCDQPGVSIAGVARAYGINANMLFMWRRKYAPQKLTDPTVLLPVQIAAQNCQVNTLNPIAALNSGNVKCTDVGEAIEIEISAVLIRLRGKVDEASLCSVLRAVRGAA